MKKIVVLLFICLINFNIVKSEQIKTLGEGSFNFSGGLFQGDQFNAPANSIQDVENFVYDVWGFLRGRIDWDREIDLLADTNSNSAFHYIDSEQRDHYIFSLGTVLYDYNGETYSKLVLPQTITSYENYRREYFVQNDILYIGDGQNRNMKYNGDSVLLMGVESPTSELSSDSIIASGDVESGDYYYFYVFKSEQNNFQTVRSNGSPISFKITVSGNSQVSLVGIDTSTNPAVTSREIYRTKKTGIQRFFYVGEISNNTDTTFIDNVADTLLGELPLTRLGRQVPRPFSISEEYKGLSFRSGDFDNPEKIYYSQISSRGQEPEYWEQDVAEFTTDDQQTISGLAALTGHMLYFTEQNSYALFINDEDIRNPDNSIRWRKTLFDKITGCINHESIQNIGDGLVFASNRGVYSYKITFAGNLTSNLTFDNFGVEMKNEFDNYMLPFKSKLRSIFLRDKYYLSYSTNGIYNDKIYVYNVISKKGAFISGIFVNDFIYDQDEEVFLAGSSLEDGLIINLDGVDKVDGLIKFENRTIAAIDEVFVDVYNDTLQRITLNSRITDTTVLDDTNIINSLQGQALYTFNSDSIFTDLTPIVANGTNTIIVRKDISNGTVGLQVKTGTRNYLIETNYKNFGDDVWTKTIEFLWFDIVSTEGSLEYIISRDRDELVYSDVFTNQVSEVSRWDDVYKWDSDFRWDPEGLQSMIKVAVPRSVLARRFKFKFSINTDEPLDLNKVIVIGNPNKTKDYTR